MRVCLVIGGFDPSSGAGVTADLAVMAAHGTFGTACVTALTVQSTMGVKAVHPVEAAVVKETLEYLAADLPPAGIKIGMLANAEIVEAVAEFLESVGRNVVVVLDPVARSSSGRALLDEDGLHAMRHRLLPLVHCVTPNISELAALAKVTVETREDVERAAEKLQSQWPGLSVVGTGGHLGRPDEFVLLPDGQRQWIEGEKIQSRSTHGTGCAFASALLCGLVQGLDGMEAASRAKAYVAEGIRRGVSIGEGIGPLALYWPMRR